MEAFVDTIKEHARSAVPVNISGLKIYRGVSNITRNDKTILIPRMAPNADAIAAAMKAFNVGAIVSRTG